MPTSSDATIDGRMDHAEVRRRLPEIELIKDEGLRVQTLDALARGVPEYFWHVPATGSGKYHNPFARRRHGLWIHVKMVFAAYERLVDSWVQQDKITEREADMGRAAVLLHDCLKYGHAYEDGDSTVKNHDKLMAHWLSHNSELPTTVVGAVEAHNGPWYEGKEPETGVEELVHIADMAASSKNGTWGVYEAADELVARYPNLPRADL